eukprot:222581-Pyramimonas_sp.AAC.1
MDDALRQKLSGISAPPSQRRPQRAGARTGGALQSRAPGAEGSGQDRGTLSSGRGPPSTTLRKTQS